MNIEQFALISLGTIFNCITFAAGVFLGASSCRRNGVDDSRRG